MSAQKTKLSNWILQLPLKFGILSFALMTIASLLKGLLFDKIFSATISSIFFGILMAVAFVTSVVFLVKRLPKTKLDKHSFISLHIAQTLIISLCFYALSYFMLVHSQYILFKLIMLESKSIVLFLLTIILLGVLLLYLTGVFISNIYAKFCRIQQFNIPIWKIVCSFPFGFAGLWTAGFLLDTKEKKEPVVYSTNKQYNRAISWTLLNPTNTLATFIIITFVSYLFFGPLSILRTFILALIYGIWVLQVGTKTFKANMAGRYATMTVVVNILIILSVILFAILIPKTSETININITDPEYITEYNQGQ